MESKVEYNNTEGRTVIDKRSTLMIKENRIYTFMEVFYVVDLTFELEQWVFLFGNEGQLLSKKRVY